jgi:hypothetical protein
MSENPAMQKLWRNTLRYSAVPEFRPPGAASLKIIEKKPDHHGRDIATFNR